MTGPREPSLRLFVAIELTPEWLQALATAQARLRQDLEKRGGPRLRWVKPEGIHLTLKFLGETPQSRLTSVHWALQQAVPAPLDFSLTLLDIGAFADRRGPRVIWVGVDGVTVPDREKLYRLAGDLETWFASAGFPREGRFHPHLTLARLPEDLSRDQRRLVADVSAHVKVPRVASLNVRAVNLVQSHLGPGGARYQHLASFPS